MAGAQQSVLTKTVSELAFASFEDGAENQFSYFFPYLVIALCIVFAVTQLLYVNWGLEYFDAVLFMPVYTAVLIVMGIFCGSVYFQEIHTQSTTSLVFFLLGASLTLVGVCILSGRSKSQQVKWFKCGRSMYSELAPGEGTPLLHKQV